MHTAFFSYSRADNRYDEGALVELGERINKALQHKLGTRKVEVFIDKAEIKLMMDWDVNGFKSPYPTTNNPGIASSRRPVCGWCESRLCKGRCKMPTDHRGGDDVAVDPRTKCGGLDPALAWTGACRSFFLPFCRPSPGFFRVKLLLGP